MSNKDEAMLREINKGNGSLIVASGNGGIAIKMYSVDDTMAGAQTTLTPDEARELAGYLIEFADAADKKAA